MSTICPTVTPDTVAEYDRQAGVLRKFAKRVHLDFMDGEFAPSTSPHLKDVTKPKGLHIDLHIMYKYPAEHLQEIIAFKPDMVVVHAEAEGDFTTFAKELHVHGIKVGVALLQPTPVSILKPVIKDIDHVLVFSGNLGYQGGSSVDFELLKKVKEIHKLKPGLEIGWDGGVSDENVKQLADGGIDVLNVGGFIMKAENPRQRFETLKNLLH
mgnify:CR=1 FL=1